MMGSQTQPQGSAAVFSHRRLEGFDFRLDPQPASAIRGPQNENKRGKPRHGTHTRLCNHLLPKATPEKKAQFPPCHWLGPDAGTPSHGGSDTGRGCSTTCTSTLEKGHVIMMTMMMTSRDERMEAYLISGHWLPP
jgi:hypothetical protein